MKDMSYLCMDKYMYIYYLRIIVAAILIWFFALEGKGQHASSDNFDDVFQYVPYASVAVLKACGVESRDEWPQLLAAMGGSWVTTSVVTYMLKHSVKEQRKDGSDNYSFPSGHTAIAFAGATLLHQEYGHISPWVSVAGYGVATATAIDRIARGRHYWYDVAAGAGVGILSAHVMGKLSKRLFKDKQVKVRH